MKITNLLQENDTRTKLTPSQETRALAVMKELVDAGEASDPADAAYGFLDNISGFETDEQARKDQADRLISLYKKKYGK